MFGQKAGEDRFIPLLNHFNQISDYLARVYGVKDLKIEITVPDNLGIAIDAERSCRFVTFVKKKELGSMDVHLHLHNMGEVIFKKKRETPFLDALRRQAKELETRSRDMVEFLEEES